MTTQNPHPNRLRSLGLAQDVKTINVIAYLFSAFVSVAGLVFLSSSTSFVLTMVVHLPAHRIGQINGSLVLLDELVALPVVLFWGRLADIYGYRAITVVGHLIVALSLVIFIQSRSESQLFLSRIFVSIGFAALTTMLSTILASMTASRLPPTLPAVCEEPIESADERTSLMTRIRKRSRIVSQRSSRLSGLIGFMSGMGALFGVFVLLRLPSVFANWTSQPTTAGSLEFGVKTAFYLAATLALLTSVLMVYGLCRQGEKVWRVQAAGPARPTGWAQSFHALTLGFRLVCHHRHLVAAYAGGFSARATSIAASAYIPVLVNQFFTSTGQCQLDRPDLPAEEVKKGCHAAFVLASELTGTVQLTALVLSPVVGWLATTCSQPVMLGVSNVVSAVGFAGLGAVGRPDGWAVWPLCVMLGVGQITGVVVSLSLCASCRWQIHHAPAALHHAPAALAYDVSGAIAGAYSLAGGAAILLGSAAALASDRSPSAPFFLSAAITATAALVCLLVSRPVPS